MKYTVNMVMTVISTASKIVEADSLQEAMMTALKNANTSE
jgi:hypothetical protein